MTNENEKNPSSFHNDQDAARRENALRDAHLWADKVANDELDLELKAAHRDLELAHIERIQAGKDAVNTLTTALIFLTCGAIGVFAVKAIEYVVGWFR